MKKRYFYRAGRVRILKAEVSTEEYRAKYPDAIPCCKPPSIGKLEKWDSAGYSRTPCGCKTEPDGTCEHGIPSWLLILGYI